MQGNFIQYSREKSASYGPGAAVACYLWIAFGFIFLILARWSENFTLKYKSRKNVSFCSEGNVCV
jgi:hypothetical protein